MNETLKKVAIYVLTALLGSGVTLVVTDGLSINCKPVASSSTASTGGK